MVYEPRYFAVTIEYPNLKRDLCLFKVEEHFKAALNGTQRKITNSGKNGFLMTVASKQQKERALKIDNVCRMKCITKQYGFFNESRGVIYIYNSEIEDMDSFPERLKEQ